MRKIICSVLISLLCSVVAFAQRIAVIDFNAGVGISQADVDGISAIFNTYFSPQGYTLVERTRIDRIIDEQQFQRGKLTEQQMVKIGQILNISQIVVGDVNIVMSQYNIDVRVLNVQSGTIAAKEGATWSQGSSYRTMMQQLATRLATQIAIKPNTVVSSSQANSSGSKGVVVLHGYLKVYPEDLGQFDSYPQRIVEQINKNAEYGYDTWRLPTREEMQLIQANKGKIGGLTSTNYMTNSTKYTKGTIRLVTDGATKSAAYQAYKLCSTLDDYRNFVKQYPSGTYTEMAKEKIKTLEAEERRAKYNGHDYVDLGLPSGLKWATCNVGATSPSEYGNYYEWGETKTNTFYKASYCKTYGKQIENISGNPIYDVARSNWGGTWRIPTADEFRELIDHCTWSLATQGGRKGCKIIGPNGNSIFLPFAGSCSGLFDEDASIKFQGITGRYWTSTNYESGENDAYLLSVIVFNQRFCVETLDRMSRYVGSCIRPVSD